MKYGRSDQQFQEIVSLLSMIFGSRALGTFKEASDIDLALFGEKVNFLLADILKANWKKKHICLSFLMLLPLTLLKMKLYESTY